jgi:3-oxoadipate enol-lactonase
MFPYQYNNQPETFSPLPAYSVEHGDGSPVMMIHGLAASHHDWEHLTPWLVKAGYATFALDLLGHGNSPKPTAAEPYHIGIVYQQVENWFDSLQISQPAVFVGHSMGGYLSLLYAIRYPERVRALILINPLFSTSQLHTPPEILKYFTEAGAWAMQHAPHWLIHALIGMNPENGKHISLQSRWQIADDMKRASPNILHLTRTIGDLTPQLRRIHQPSMVIWGDKDRTLQPRVFPRLLRELNQAAGYVVHGGGHQPHISHIEQVNHMILDFMRHLEQSNTPPHTPTL